jgi:hypothetical protein
MKSLTALSLISLSAFANTPGYISDFNYQVSDLATMGLSRQTLFEKMERKMLDLENSICANRAHMWAYDLSKYNIQTGKIFLFFGSSIWTDDKHGYMYHVAPYIVDNGVEYMMEASYGDLSEPLKIKEWVENETYGRVTAADCIELTAEDTDMTEYFYERINLPEKKRPSGKPAARCYYRRVPGYYWFPASIAYHDLKRDADGVKFEFDPKDFDKDDVVEACVEAASSKFGRFFGGGRLKCQAHLGIKK